jgi:uncharacterized membrane protein (UPF0136 family)
MADKSEKHIPQQPNVLPSKLPGTDARFPDTDSKAEKAAAPIATLSSHVDPWPHYIMSLACGGGSAFAYSRLNNPRASAVAGGFALAYLFAGRQLSMGNTQFGYDMGTATSVALTAAVAPRAYQTGEAYSVAMASLGAISSVANLIKSYQFRTDKPEEMHHTGTRHH